MSEATSLADPTSRPVGPSHPLRVLWLIKGLGPGGAEHLLLSTAGVADAQRFRFEIAYLLPWKTALVERLAQAGVPSRCLDAPNECNPAWALRLRRLLLEERFDVVHVHSPYVAGVAELVMRSLPPGRRSPVVTTEHNVWSSHPLPTRVLNTVTFPLARAQVAVSGSVRDSIPRPLRRRVEVVVHGVDVEAIQERRDDRGRIRAELGVGDDEVVVCTIANLRRQKGYPDLLAAARTVLDAGEPVLFVIVGQGQLEGEIRERHRQLGLGDRVRFLGYRQDAVSVLAGSDVFALASIHEGYPIAVMEALSMGVPIVATSVGGVPEAVRPGLDGFIVPPGEPGALAEAILRLVTDADMRKRMGEAGRTRSGRYDISRAVRRLEEIYVDLAAQ